MKTLGAVPPRPPDDRPSPLALDFEAWGLPLIESVVAKNESAAVDAAERVGFPVVLKLLSSEVHHKTELGGVRLDLRSTDEVRAVFGGLTDSASAAGFEISGVSVSPYRPGLELIVGGHIDSVFGPLVSVGFGGIATELIGDVTFAPAPVTEPEAKAMIDRLRMRPLLDGIRGEGPVNRDDLIRVVVQVSRGIAGGHYSEFELNPLIWDGEWVAVDVLAVET